MLKYYAYLSWFLSTGLVLLNLWFHWQSMLKLSIIHVSLLACDFGCCLKQRSRVFAGMLVSLVIVYDKGNRITCVSWSGSVIIVSFEILCCTQPIFFNLKTIVITGIELISHKIALLAFYPSIGWTLQSVSFLVLAWTVNEIIVEV
jgi:hypothetical protein